MNDDEYRQIYNDAMELPNRNAVSVMRFIIAAHTAKLLDGTERPEPVLWQYANTETVTAAMVGYKPAPTWKPLYTADQLQVFAASAALKAREQALEEAKGACLDLMMVNSVSGYSGLGPIDIFHQTVGICANSIEALNV